VAEFKTFCERFSPLTEEALIDLLESSSSKSYRKGQYLVRKNQTCEHLFFIEQGLLKMFFVKNDKQFVMRFFSENVMFSVFDSYIPQAPSMFSLIALEDTTVTRVSHEAMERLCKKHHCMETFFRKLLSIATVKMGRRIKEMLEAESAVRYNQFVKDNKDIAQRVNLADIANYLGITQQSLSRIRARK
jgi:CRP/FNR family transcriptional regulator, anaerobic regulatory protein